MAVRATAHKGDCGRVEHNARTPRVQMHTCTHACTYAYTAVSIVAQREETTHRASGAPETRTVPHCSDCERVGGMSAIEPRVG